MGLRLDWITIDATNARRLATFWAEALDYEIVRPPDDDEVLLVARDGSRRRLLVLPAPGGKIAKNRLHLDLRPDDQEAEVRRLEHLGARRLDIGQGEVSWIVLADPEGNEFCVLRALNEDERATVPFGD